MRSLWCVLVVSVGMILCLHYPQVSGQSGGTSWRKFAGCLQNKLGFTSLVNPTVICAATQMVVSYNRMNNYQCKNCDKYFHCEANYNAVAGCGRSSSAKRTAEVISDCREFSQGGTDADSRADQAANRHGRALNSCSKYLCAANCKYNPSNRSCRKSNC